MSHLQSMTATSSSCLDGIAAAVLGFVLGLCVNAAAPSMQWFLWMFGGH